MTISLPLRVSGLCLDEAVMTAALDVGMIVIARVNYNCEITDILSAHMSIAEAHKCANSYDMANQNDYYVIAMFPAEDGVIDFISGDMLKSLTRFEAMALGA